MKTKEELRKELVLMRKSLPSHEVGILSERVINRLKNVSQVNEARALFVYISSGNEVNTHDFVKEMLILGKVVLVPQVVNDTMVVCRLNNFNELELRNGFLVPCTPPSDIKPDVCVAPGVGFSEGLDRMGRGCGYYDQYLEKYPVFVIGLGYEEQIMEIPTESHDVKMDLVVTDKRVIS